jgi:hypothetical protein
MDGLCVVKAHTCVPELASVAKAPSSRVVYCYRDIRNVAVSVIRKYQLSFDELVGKGWLDQAIADFYSWTEMPNVLVSRYETMTNDLGREAIRLSRFLNLEITPEKASALASRYEVTEQLKRMAALTSGADCSPSPSELLFDSVELIHHNHIFIGDDADWRRHLSKNQGDFLTDRFFQWLSILGYEDRDGFRFFTPTRFERLTAEEAEARALSERALAEENRRWAEEAEARALSERALAEENRRWAEEAEARALTPTSTKKYH